MLHPLHYFHLLFVMKIYDFHFSSCLFSVAVMKVERKVIPVAKTIRERNADGGKVRIETRKRQSTKEDKTKVH